MYKKNPIITRIAGFLNVKCLNQKWSREGALLLAGCNADRLMETLSLYRYCISINGYYVKFVKRAAFTPYLRMLACVCVREFSNITN